MDLDEVISDDEDFIPVFERIYRRRKPKCVQIRVNYFEKLDNAEFFARFRLTKETTKLVLEVIKDSIAFPTHRNNALSPEEKLLLTLRYYASGNFLINVGDLSGVHVTTTSKVVREVSRALAAKREDFIYFPQTNEELNATKAAFFKIARFPRCVGALDCTHVRIQSPGGDRAELFRNRKGFYSINVQCVCDANLRISDIVARWPGSSHDAHIYHSSRICSRIENGEFGDSLFVGDSGYGLSPTLITPLTNPETDAQVLFQESQIRTRNPIERCFGVWKRRFPVLATGIRLNIRTVEAVIVATAILHNIATSRGEEVPPATVEEMAAINFANNVPVQAANNQQARQAITRNVIIHYFSGLL